MSEQVIQSPTIERWLEIGAAADSLGVLSTARPDLCIRLAWGRLEAGYWDEEARVCVGTRGIEPTSRDWKEFAARAGAIPPRKDYPS